MNDIVPISSHTIGAAAVPTVNMRDLHAKLGSKQHFADWSKERLSEAMATEGSDFIVHKVMKKSGRPLIDYYVTIETAKNIAMLERNEKGKEIRTYFINAENTLREMRAAIPARNMGPVELARLHLAAALRLEASGKAMEMLVPLNQYGELAPNGRAKLGLRRAAFVASRHRRDAAEEFIATMEKIDELERQLELGLEEVAA